MRTNTFGERQPATADEIIEAMEMEWDLDDLESDIYARIEHTPDEAEPFNGWCAEIIADERQINTCAFPTKEAVIAALKSAGIDDVETAQ